MLDDGENTSWGLAVAEGTGEAATPGAVGGRDALLGAEGTGEVSTPGARELREEGGSVLGTTRGGAVWMRRRLERLGR